MRRGSVEEDMNSYPLPRDGFTGISVGSVQIIGSMMDSLEGANGAYHFFNP